MDRAGDAEANRVFASPRRTAVRCRLGVRRSDRVAQGANIRRAGSASELTTIVAAPAAVLSVSAKATAIAIASATRILSSVLISTTALLTAIRLSPSIFSRPKR